MNVKYFLCSAIITITLTTGALLMPFAEYNSSRYMTADMQKMSELSFDQEALTVGMFGEKMTLKTSTLSKAIDAITPFLPNELKLSAELVQYVAEYIGEAQSSASP